MVPKSIESISFSHDKIREALVARLSDSELLKLHRRTAEYLMQRRPVADAEVALYFDAAQCAKQALPFAVRAARKASSETRFNDAIVQFEIAERSSEFATQQEKYEIHTGLGNVLMERGEYDRVAQHFHDAAKHASNDLESARAFGNQAEIQRRTGHLGDSCRMYRKSLEAIGVRLPKTNFGMCWFVVRAVLVRIAHLVFPKWFLGSKKRPPNERERLAMHLLSGLSKSNVNGSSAIQTYVSHLRGINDGEKFLPSPELAQIYVEQASASSFHGQYIFVEPYMHSAKEILRDEPATLRDGTLAMYGSICNFCTARYEESIHDGRKAVKLLQRVGDYWQIHMARYQLAASLYQIGHYRDAITEAKKNYDSGVEKGDFQASRIVLDVWARSLPGGRRPR